MSDDPLDYPILLQDALRGVVRRGLEIVAEQGFTGEHHFYITFLTGAPGVVMPPHLRDSYPDEMTIVLKTQQGENMSGPCGTSILRCSRAKFWASSGKMAPGKVPYSNY